MLLHLKTVHPTLAAYGVHSTTPHLFLMHQVLVHSHNFDVSPLPQLDALTT